MFIFILIYTTFKSIGPQPDGELPAIYINIYDFQKANAEKL